MFYLQLLATFLWVLLCSIKAGAGVNKPNGACLCVRTYASVREKVNTAFSCILARLSASQEAPLPPPPVLIQSIVSVCSVDVVRF